ncbi:MAG: hypothetical protein AABW83_04310 [Nanoarchaeota archaeon]
MKLVKSKSKNQKKFPFERKIATSACKCRGLISDFSWIFSDI